MWLFFFALQSEVSAGDFFFFGAVLGPVLFFHTTGYRHCMHTKTPGLKVQLQFGTG
jgi:hypothetical protein